MDARFECGWISCATLASEMGRNGLARNLAAHYGAGVVSGPRSRSRHDRNRVCWPHAIQIWLNFNGEYVLRGKKAGILAGPMADKFAVSARVENGSHTSGGIAVFILDRNVPGCAVAITI
jgi:hypothetical protein